MTLREDRYRRERDEAREEVTRLREQVAEFVYEEGGDEHPSYQELQESNTRLREQVAEISKITLDEDPVQGVRSMNKLRQLQDDVLRSNSDLLKALQAQLQAANAVVEHVGEGLDEGCIDTGRGWGFAMRDLYKAYRATQKGGE